MDINGAINAFAALSQPTRLEVFRLLIKASPEGRLAGDIGKVLGVRQNTMSANLAVLLAAGLVRNEREGKSIRYFANMEGVSGLLEFLMEDCCGSQPDLCKRVIDDIVCLKKG